MSKPKRLAKMVSFRADAVLMKRLKDAKERADRPLADTVRRLVIRSLDAEELGTK